MPRWWGSAQGRKINNATFGKTQVKKDDLVLLRICAAATKELHWQVLHRLLQQEWQRLKAEQAAILNQPHPPMVNLKSWYANLKPPEIIPEPGHDPRRARWQGSSGIPESASVLEREKRPYTHDRRKSGAPVIDDAGRILDGGIFRPMTPAEKRKYGMYPSLRERRALRRMELEESQKREKRA